LAARLGGLVDDPGGQVPAAATHDVSGAEEQVGAFLGGRVAPGRERRLGRRDRLAGLLRAGLAAAPGPAGPVRRADRRQRFRRRRLAPADDRLIRLAELAGDTLQGVFQRLTHFLLAEVGGRLLPKVRSTKYEGRRRGGRGRFCFRTSSFVLRTFFDGAHEQHLLGDVFGEAGPQEGVVGGVL